MNPTRLNRNKTKACNSALDARRPIAQTRDALAVHALRVLELLKHVLTDSAVVADGLDVEQTPVGLEADLPQRRQVVQPLADGEIAWVVDGGLGAQGAGEFAIWVDLAPLVVDIERGRDPVGDHARAEATRRAAGNAAVEDQLDLVGPPEVEVFAQHLLEEQPVRGRSST